MFRKVQLYCNNSKLKINNNECETILFRPKLINATREVKKNWKSFKIKPNDGADEYIPHKLTVKYLGVNIDQHLTYTEHLTIQISKARKAFFKLRRLFYNKNLDSTIKINCYCTLIRLLLTYGCTIWFNQRPPIIETLRVFERKCLRSCMGCYRSADTDFMHYLSNQYIYNKAKIPRIDIHLLKIIRNHWANTAGIHINNLILGPCYVHQTYIKKTLKSGYVPPEGFLFLDANKYIQDINNVPIIYHAHRKRGQTHILYESNLITTEENILWRYEMSLPARDENDKSR